MSRVAVGPTCEWDADHDDDDAHDDGDDAEQASQPPQPPGPVDVAALQAVSGLETDRQTDGRTEEMQVIQHTVWTQINNYLQGCTNTTVLQIE